MMMMMADLYAAYSGNDLQLTGHRWRRPVTA